MMIYMLAAAMTVAMLIATAFSIHHESQKAELRERSRRFSGFGR